MNMKTPEDIKKGLEYCARSFQDRSACRECAYEALCFAAMPRSVLLKDLCAYVTQLKAREWDLFDLLSSAWFGKQCYFQQEDGTVYSRSSGEYMSFDQAIDEFASELTNETQLEAQVPKWISVQDDIPVNEDDVLVLLGGKDADIGWFNGYNGDWHTYYGCVAGEVTHWMPIPQLPEV